SRIDDPEEWARAPDGQPTPLLPPLPPGPAALRPLPVCPPPRAVLANAVIKRAKANSTARSRIWWPPGRRVPRRLRYRSRAHDLAGSVELDPQQLQPLLVMPPQPEDADWSATVPEDVGQERERGVAESGGVAQIHGNVFRAAQGDLDLQSR